MFQSQGREGPEKGRCAGYYADSHLPEDLAASTNHFISLMTLWVRIEKGSTRPLSLGVVHAVTGWLGLGSSEGTPGLMPKEAHSRCLMGAAGNSTTTPRGGPSHAIFLG